MTLCTICEAKAAQWDLSSFDPVCDWCAGGIVGEIVGEFARSLESVWPTRPSKHFFIAQAALQVFPANLWKQWWTKVSQTGEPSYISNYLHAQIIWEYRLLVSRYV